MEPLLLGPGEGERHDAGPAQIVIKATSEHTGGTFFLSETDLAPGFAGPPPHRHRELHDMFYVLEGTLTLVLGDREVRAAAGTFACAPPGAIHTFRNDSAATVRMLNFSTPGGWERYMRELAGAAEDGPLTPEVIGRVASHHDFEAVSPGS
jgi:quercetin dioxygenase-like cupin family protein